MQRFGFSVQHKSFCNNYSKWLCNLVANSPIHGHHSRRDHVLYHNSVICFHRGKIYSMFKSKSSRFLQVTSHTFYNRPQNPWKLSSWQFRTWQLLSVMCLTLFWCQLWQSSLELRLVGHHLSRINTFYWEFKVVHLLSSSENLDLSTLFKNQVN